MTSENPKKISKFGQTFISYGSYHYNTVNAIIHIICIPIITATLIAALSYIPYRYQLYGYDLGCEHIFAAFALTFYLTSVGVYAFLIMGAFLLAGSLAWKQVFSGYSGIQMRNTLIILHIVGWVFQFIGHGVFQKRKPALLDNLSQIFSAPLFVIIELFDLIGLRTSQIQLWKQQIKKNVMQYRANKSSTKTA